jgi:alpha-L-fucosidase
MASNYESTSPYFTTGITQFYLDVMVNRPIPKLPDDLKFTINQTYQYRPDLLAFDLYDTATLWWVFYQRNPNALSAPPLDFAEGVVIYLPKITTLKATLGF